MAKGKAREPPSAVKPDPAAAEAANEADVKIKPEEVPDAAADQAEQQEEGGDAAGSQAEPDEQSEGFVTGGRRLIVWSNSCQTICGCLGSQQRGRASEQQLLLCCEAAVPFCTCSCWIKTLMFADYLCVSWSTCCCSMRSCGDRCDECPVISDEQYLQQI
jgi:hypothetical protein